MRSSFRAGRYRVLGFLVYGFFVLGCTDASGPPSSDAGADRSIQGGDASTDTFGALDFQEETSRDAAQEIGVDQGKGHDGRGDLLGEAHLFQDAIVGKDGFTDKNSVATWDGKPDAPPDKGLKDKGVDAPPDSKADAPVDALPVFVDGSCTATGSPCKLPSECCSGKCDGKLCIGALVNCEGVGDACSASAECCSGKCETVASGSKECVVGGCEALGNACTKAVECCGLSCVLGKCAASPICAMIGASCTTPSDCCSNLCTANKCASTSSTCVTEGEKCSGNASCCSGNCESVDGTLRCVSVSLCRAEGELCVSAGDCCTGVCGADGRCPEMALCQTAGEPCTGHFECCSGLCADPGTGVKVCQYVSGCRPIGEVCTSNTGCCSGLCQDYLGTGVYRCSKPGGCMASGEVCWLGMASNCCPSGPSGGNALCLPTVFGVTRCYQPGLGPKPLTDAGTAVDAGASYCLADGKTCTFAQECCGGFCLPNSSGVLVCATTCAILGGVCTADFDCCNGLCVDGLCSPYLFDCKPLGGSCTAANECCSNFCSSAGICSVN